MSALRLSLVLLVVAFAVCGVVGITLTLLGVDRFISGAACGALTAWATASICFDLRRRA